jgi:hypothetical protein
VIEDGVTGIGTSAFAGCGNLTFVIIPQSLEVEMIEGIGRSAFANCKQLTSVINLSPTPQSLSKNVNQFDSVPLENAVLYVPAGSETKYQEAIGWMNFGRKEVVVMSGNCGENESSDVTWNFDLPKRVLTVSGTGAIMDIDTPPPWHLFQ